MEVTFVAGVYYELGFPGVNLVNNLVMSSCSVCSLW